MVSLLLARGTSGADAGAMLFESRLGMWEWPLGWLWRARATSAARCARRGDRDMGVGEGGGVGGVRERD